MSENDIIITLDELHNSEEYKSFILSCPESKRQFIESELERYIKTGFVPFSISDGCGVYLTTRSHIDFVKTVMGCPDCYVRIDDYNESIVYVDEYGTESYEDIEFTNDIHHAKSRVELLGGKTRSCWRIVDGKKIPPSFA